MKKLAIKRAHCSYYENVKSKQNRVITLAQFVTAIRSERWKKAVEDFRRYMAEGKDGEAKRIKEGLPGIVSAGVCEGGHSKQNVRSVSQLMVLDIDHYEGDIHGLIHRLYGFPWVQAAWISVSGRGAKAEVVIDAQTVEEYETRVYPIVAQYFSRNLDIPVDMHCKDINRLCYVSYDPDAFCKDEECPPFPWREEWEKSAQKEAGSKQPGSPETSMKSVNLASGMVESFLDGFLEQHPFVPHYRHDFLLKLGRDASRYGMNQEEFEKLVDLAVEKLAMPDCDGPEIKYTLADAYRYAEVKGLKKTSHFGFRGHKGHPVPLEEMEDETEQAENERDLRLSAPFIPDWVFENLPDILTEGLTVARNPRQRDMLFLSMLANLSACLPGVRMVYDDTDVYPHLFLAVVASSASGKGIMAHAAKLGRNIQKMLDEENETLQKKYEEATLVWEQEMQRSRKEGRKPDMKLRPDPVHRKTLMVPADVSRSQLIKLMSASPMGVLLNVSEMDTLRVAVSTEYGRFDDLMRACFHHEMFGSDFKTDKQQFMVYCPKMAFCSSGTPGQFHRLCPSDENGSYSRYLIYMAEQEAHFLRMSPQGERQNKNRLFLKLADKVLDMYRYLRANPTEVCFTPDQWDWHQSYYQSMLQDVLLEKADGPVSVIYRHGLNTARLAMIFTALRKYDERWSFYELKCSDDDFRRAMAVMEVLLEHSLMLSTTLRKEGAMSAPMTNYFRIQEALATLKSEFRYHELMDALVSKGMSLTTAKRVRVRLLKMGVIVKEEDTYRFVHRKWRRVLRQSGRN